MSLTVGLCRLCLLGALAAVPMPRASAVLLTVTNAGFEDITGNTLFNEFTLVVPNGWTEYNPNTLTSGSGLYYGTLDTDGTFFDPPPNPAPEGDRVAILYNQNQKGSGEYGIQQTLADTLQPLMTYTLQVEVGNIGSGTADDSSVYNLDGFPGYRVDLLAGTTVIASDSNSLVIAERSFATSAIQFTTGASGPLLGQALTIRLVSLNSPFEPDSNFSPYDAHEVDFDHVRLAAIAAVPEPSTVMLLAVGAVILARRYARQGMFRRGRNAAA